MSKFTSTVCASIARVDMRKAFSGARRSSVLAAGAAPVASRISRNARILPMSGFGLGIHPGEVPRQAALDSDRDDLGKFVGMHRPDRGLQGGIALGRRLDQHRMLFVVLHGAFPAVRRAARRKDVDAGGKAPLD